MRISVPLVGFGGESSSQMELLWENASPESTFAAQIISLDLSCYKTIKIVHSYGEFNVSVGSFSAPMYYSEERLAANATPVFYSRGFTVNSDGVVCTDGFYTYPIANAVSSVANSVLIPLCVYGIKGVS